MNRSPQQSTRVGLPGHGVVVGLALLVAQGEVDAADRHVQGVVIRRSGIAVLVGQFRSVKPNWRRLMIVL